MSISARNRLKATITQIKTGAINSLITAKLSDKESLKAIITTDSQESLGLKVGLGVVFLFKASSVAICAYDELNLSATNQIKGIVKAVNNGMVNSEIVLDINGSEISSIITKESAKDLNLKVGDRATAIIKATDIMVGIK